MFDNDLEVDVLALQSLSSPSELLDSDLGALNGAATCNVTQICVAATLQICCVTIACNGTACVVATNF